MAVDPVCKMFIDSQNSNKSIEYNDFTYNFCSTFCLELFKKNPNKYLEKNVGGMTKALDLYNYSENQQEKGSVFDLNLKR